MKILIFGASGMVGGGVLRECLADPGVEEVVSVVRSVSELQHEKLKEIAHADFLDFRGIEKIAFTGIDAAFFCLGVSSGGMSEADYTRVTYGFTLAAATTLESASPNATFIYVSGVGADSTGQGRTMWARVRGRTENALQALQLRSFIFRPALIQPQDGAISRTPSYRWLYRIAGPVLPMLRMLFPGSVTGTRQIGRAMLSISRNGAPKRVLNSADINAFET